jgi:hypothetical protein
MPSFRVIRVEAFATIVIITDEFVLDFRCIVKELMTFQVPKAFKFWCNADNAVNAGVLYRRAEE